MEEATIPAGTHRSVHWLHKSRSWLVTFLVGLATIAATAVVGDASLERRPRRLADPQHRLVALHRRKLQARPGPAALVDGVHG